MATLSPPSDKQCISLKKKRIRPIQTHKCSHIHASITQNVPSVTRCSWHILEASSDRKIEQATKRQSKLGPTGFFVLFFWGKFRFSAFVFVAVRCVCTHLKRISTQNSGISAVIKWCWLFFRTMSSRTQGIYTQKSISHKQHNVCSIYAIC